MREFLDKFLENWKESGKKIILLHHPEPKPDQFIKSDIIHIDNIPPFPHDIPKSINTRSKDQLL